MKVENIIQRLEKTNGLGNIRLLASGHKQLIRSLEEENNYGVFECINRKFTLLLTHDSSFREPAGEIVVDNNGRVILPPVDFPEVNGRDVVSSSPSAKVHNAIVEALGLKLSNGEATLLIGFNL